MQVQLIVNNKTQGGKAIPVNVSAFRIGRAEGCHLRSNSSRISPHHCVIYTQEGKVTLQDLGGETGTFVNGNRILGRLELKDGDELTAGRHTFILSIKQNAETIAEKKPPIQQAAASPPDVFELAPIPLATPKAEPEPEAEVMFEIRHKGQNVSVTKKRLLDMALKGSILPDDVITVAGTKIFADSVEGIVFGTESPVTKTGPGTQHAELYAVSAPPVATYNNSTDPFDTTGEPSAQVARTPGARKDVTFTDIGKSLEEPLSQASTWVSGKVSESRITKEHVMGVVFGIVVLCLLGGLVYWLLPEQKSEYGAVRIYGTLTLDGKPVEGASVVFHPRDDENGFVAGGMTKKGGAFTVTTGNDPPGLGAVPGEYDVTFKSAEVPEKYWSRDTSGQFITVESGGQRVEFKLTTEVTPSRLAPDPEPEETNNERADGH
ncbi:MAG: FHA domain-containing protein [Planctomycetaceae bacterium]|nr:FHA domain-containing protein [Planctomycetaceae bacterium]